MGRLVLGGTGTGVGKTTAALALMAALRRRGLDVRPFKVGPDFIDPGYHRLACSRPSRNLDGWMLPREAVVDLVRGAGDGFAVIEGVMGLFDGVDGRSEAGSTAALAKWLQAPVLLVVDVGGLARSAAAVVQGFESFDPGLRLGGLLFNRVGGAGHYRMLQEALAGHVTARPLGYLPWDRALTIPERHLGLVTAEERGLSPDLLERLANALERHADVDAIIALGKTARPLADSQGRPRAASMGKPIHRVRVAVARDAAFCFYYEENLELLQARGADLVPFSPLTDPVLPAGVHGVYLGGGYPEVHAAALAANGSLLEELRTRAADGLPVYAECGGFMYCTEGIEDEQGVFHPMVGLFPTRASMREPRLTLGYVEVEVTAENILGGAGLRTRGHVFHASRTAPMPATVRRTYRLRRAGGPEMQEEGYAWQQVLGSYAHLHFLSNPTVADGFVRACRRHAGMLPVSGGTP
ncbi:MAG: cobyrinate a,c-diamide synthase [Deltaproteobacteria bacterium]|nr:cobyrinate a,c-diamide synthase [Deltaproteobacteria bacterium]